MTKKQDSTAQSAEQTRIHVRVVERNAIQPPRSEPTRARQQPQRVEPRTPTTRPAQPITPNNSADTTPNLEIQDNDTTNSSTANELNHSSTPVELPSQPSRHTSAPNSQRTWRSIFSSIQQRLGTIPNRQSLTQSFTRIIASTRLTIKHTPRTIRTAITQAPARLRAFPATLRSFLRTLPATLKAWYRQHFFPALGGFLLTIAILPFLALSVQAANAELVPDSDVTTGWPTTTGTSHYTEVNEGSTAPDTGTYFASDNTDNTSYTNEFSVTNQANIDSATDITLRIYANTTIQGADVDTVTLDARINGTLLGSQTITPSQGSWAWREVFWTGSWTQADIDSLQVSMIRNVVGGGSPPGRGDEIRIATVAVDLTYTSAITLEQSSYRWYENDPGSTTGTFAEAFGGTGEDRAQGVVATSDGGYAVTGYTDSLANPTSGFADMILTKYAGNGTISWTRTWGGTGEEIGFDVIETSDNGLLVAGETTSYGAGSDALLLVKYNSAGTLQWAKTWAEAGGSGAELAEAITETSDGGFIATGWSDSLGSGGAEVVVVRFDSSGNEVWSRTWGGADLEYGLAVIEANNGDVVITGQTESFAPGTVAMFLVRYDSTGNLLWSQTWGDAGIDSAYDLIELSTGDIVVTGRTSSFGPGTEALFVTRFDSSGNEVWARTWGGSGIDSGLAITEAGNDDFVVAGRTTSYGSGGEDFLLIKYDSGGNVLWESTFGGGSNDFGNGVDQTSDGGFVMAGRTLSYGPGSNYNLMIARFDNLGQILNCSTECSSPTGSTTTPTATSNTPTVNESTPSISMSSPTGVETSPTPTIETVIPFPVYAGAPLGAQDTPVEAPVEGTPFRLRASVSAGLGDLPADSTSLKLQYSELGPDTVCDTGFSGENYQDVYDIDGEYTDWNEATASAPWSGRLGHGTVYFNEKLYVMGGRSGSTYFDDVWSSSDGVNWTQETDSAPGRASAGTVVFDGRIWMVGGALSANNGARSSNVASSTDGVVWNTEATSSPWSARYNHQVIVFNDKIFVIGGFGSSLLNDVWSSPNGVNWTEETASAPWGTRDNHQAVVFNNKIFVIGGQEGSNQVTNDVWSSPDGVNWTEETASAPWSAREDHEVSVLNDRLWLTGGFDGFDSNSKKNDVWSSPDGVNWTEETASAPWDPRIGHDTLSVGSRLWLSGGTTTTDVSDVWFLEHLPPGDIMFARNESIQDGSPIAPSLDDPNPGSGNAVMQAYVESNNFTNPNAIPNGDYGIWDFSLVDNGAPGDATYCFRIVDSGGSELNSYSVIPELSIPPPTYSQADYRWFESGGDIRTVEDWDRYPGTGAFLPGTGYDATFTSDENTLVFAHASGNGVTLVDSSDPDPANWTKITNSNISLPGTGYAATFTSDDNTLVLAHDGGDYVTLVDSSDPDPANWTEITNSNITLPGRGITADFLNNDDVLVMHHFTSPRFTIIDSSDPNPANWTEITNGNIDITGATTGTLLAISGDENTIAIAAFSAGVVTIDSSDPDPANWIETTNNISLAGDARTVRFTSDDNVLVVGHDGGDYVTFVDSSDPDPANWTTITNSNVVLDGSGRAATFTSDEDVLVLGHENGKHITFVDSRLNDGLGLPLTDQNTPANLDEPNQAVRLRMLMDVDDKNAMAGDFKLQYAPRITDTCTSDFSGYTYQDVPPSTGSGDITYFDNTNTEDGMEFDASVDDPTNGRTTVLQTYVEDNTFSLNNSVLSGQTTMWDFVVEDNTSLGGNYCFRIVHSSGSLLDNYTHIAELGSPPRPQQFLRHGRWFDTAEQGRPFYW